MMRYVIVFRCLTERERMAYDGRSFLTSVCPVPNVSDINLVLHDLCMGHCL